MSGTSFEEDSSDELPHERWTDQELMELKKEFREFRMQDKEWKVAVRTDLDGLLKQNEQFKGAKSVLVYLLPLVTVVGGVITWFFSIFKITPK